MYVCVHVCLHIHLYTLHVRWAINSIIMPITPIPEGKGLLIILIVGVNEKLHPMNF